MNNRILAALFALAIALFIGVAPVKAEAATCNHATTTYVSDDAGHTKVCKTCNTVLEGALDHSGWTYVQGNDGTHTKTCAVCNHKVTETHTAVGSGNICRCEFCSKLVDHTMELKSNSTVHWEECKNCDYATSKVAHDWDVTSGENGNHSKKCTVCEKEVTEACVDVNTDKDCLCDTCKVAMATTEHKLVKVAAVAKKTCTDEGSFEHFKCEYCGKLFSVVDYRELTAEEIIDKADEHDESVNWKSDQDSHWHVCKTEGCEVGKLSEAAHTYEWNQDATTHWQACSVCGYTPAGAEHDFEFVSNGDGTHSKKCKTCGYAVESVNCWDGDVVDCKCQTCGGLVKHEISPLSTVNKKSAKCLEDGYEKHYKCNTCGNLFNYDGKTCTLTSAEEVKIPATGHVKTEVVHYQDYHVERCKKCGVEVSAQVAHDFTYTDNNNGTHTATCSGCSRTITEAHTDVDTDNDCVCDAGCGHVMNHVREDLTYHGAVEATCTTDGNLAYFTCKTCKAVFAHIGNGVYAPYTDEIVTKALGHDWEWEENVSGQHIVHCKVCEAKEIMGHTDTDGDCLCDFGTCNTLVHSHTLIHFDEVPASCGIAGTEEYYKYKDCGKMFDMNQNPITAPVEIPALDHVAGDEFEAIDGNQHAIKCEKCGEVMQTETHVDSNEDNRCDVCKVELTLVEVPEKPATCTDIGYEKCWKSPLTGRMYADPYGNEHITSQKVIPAKGHTYTISNGAQHECEDCGHAEAHAASEEHPCFCSECNLPIGGHTIEAVAAVEPTCTKAGTEAYVKCSCGAMYDAQGNVITKVKTIPATGHILDTTMVNDTAEGDHYMTCTVCGYEAHEGHAMAVKDPLKGNYHQYVCDCGKVVTEQHADKDGDNICDACDHDMSGSSVEVENHDSKTVVTGEAETVDNSKSWIQNWFSNLFGSNAGGSASSNSTKESATTNGSTQDSKSDASGNQASAAANSGNEVTNSGSSGQNSNTNTSTETGIINEFIQWLSQLFGAWLQGK